MVVQVWQVTRRVAALGASVLSPRVLFYRPAEGEWETLRPEDAEAGEFLPLSDGTRMHYTVRGADGPAVVLIHGLMSSTDEWAKNMDALAQVHRTWAIDLIGFGYSSRLAEPKYSCKYLANSVHEFLDRQGIARASIVGHSLGGAVALQLAHDAPEHVDKLILIDAAAYIFGWFRMVRLMTSIPYVPRALARRMLANPRVHESSLRNALGDPAQLDERALAARLRATRVKGTLDALLAMSASPQAAEGPEGLDRITVPVLILWGEQDFVLPLRHGRRLARDLPNAHLEIVPGAGHLPNEERPERVNALMLEFLSRDDGAGRPN